MKFGTKFMPVKATLTSYNFISCSRHVHLWGGCDTSAT